MLWREVIAGEVKAIYKLTLTTTFLTNIFLTNWNFETKMIYSGSREFSESFGTFRAPVASAVFEEIDSHTYIHT